MAPAANTGLERRLHALEDRPAIRELRNRYCAFIDAEKWDDTPEAVEAIAHAVPFGWMATAEEIAQVFLFLASDAAGRSPGRACPSMAA